MQLSSNVGRKYNRQVDGPPKLHQVAQRNSMRCDGGRSVRRGGDGWELKPPSSSRQWSEDTIMIRARSSTEMGVTADFSRRSSGSNSAGKAGDGLESGAKRIKVLWGSIGEPEIRGFLAGVGDGS